MPKKPPKLPIAGASPERADAARNRALILRIAAELIAEHGIENLTMDQVAKAAGVGVGTIYRRFTDRAGLAQALLDDDERKFQERFLQGPPPIGPSAPPKERIRAFLHAYVDRLENQSELLLVAETNTPLARFTTGAYQLHRNHLAGLIHAANPTADALYIADALLAPLAAAQFSYQRTIENMSTQRIKNGLDNVLAGATNDPPLPR